VKEVLDNMHVSFIRCAVIYPMTLCIANRNYWLLRLHVTDVGKFRPSPILMQRFISDSRGRHDMDMSFPFPMQSLSISKNCTHSQGAFPRGHSWPFGIQFGGVQSNHPDPRLALACAWLVRPTSLIGESQRTNNQIVIRQSAHGTR